MIGDACPFTPRRSLSLRYSPEQKGAKRMVTMIIIMMMTMIMIMIMMVIMAKNLKKARHG